MNLSLPGFSWFLFWTILFSFLWVLLNFLCFQFLKTRFCLSFPSTAMCLKKKNFASLHFIFVQGTISDEIGDMIIAVAVCWVLIMNLAIDWRLHIHYPILFSLSEWMIKLGNRMIKEPVPGNTPQSCLQPGPSNWLLVASSLLLSSCLSAIQWTGINLLLCLTANSPHHLLSVFCVNQAIVWCFWTHKLNLHSHPGRWLFLSSLCRWDESLSEQLPQTKARSYFLTMTQWCINIKFHLLSMAFMSRFPPLSPCVDPCSVKGLNLPPPSIFAFSFLPQALYLPSA